MEYRRFYEMDDVGPTFAGTDTVFHVGDTVEANGKEYCIDCFYQSVHARPNEVDWLLLQRHDGMHAIHAACYPSEARLISRPVK